MTTLASQSTQAVGGLVGSPHPRLRKYLDSFLEVAILEDLARFSMDNKVPVIPTK